MVDLTVSYINTFSYVVSEAMAHLSNSSSWCGYDIDEYPVPGRRCPACLERGDTVWVIPGKCCPICGTPVN